MDEPLPPVPVAAPTEAVDYDEPPVVDEAEDAAQWSRIMDRALLPYAVAGMAILLVWRLAGVGLTDQPEAIPSWVQFAIAAVLTLFVMGYPVWAIRRCGGRVFSGRLRFVDVLLEGAIALGAEADIDVVGDAADGEGAVAIAECLQPDVMLLDIAMPGLDGLEALPLILERSPGTRVVVLTGFASAELRERALAAGAAGYLVKDLGPAQIAAELRGVGAGTR